MALLRGDENYHSYILSWNLVPENATWEGGLWGWNPPDPDDGCEAYPASTLVRLTQPESPGVQIFCGGLAALPDGRLLVTGGTDRVGETAGIKDARLFDAGTRAWSVQDTMAFRRYYPTNTTLPDGRMLVTTGWQFDHMLSFGGRTTPAQSSSAQKKIERLSILKNASWDAPITDPGGATPWPEARAFHTAAVRTDPNDAANTDYLRMIVFGGLDTAGVAMDDAWALQRSQWYDNTERYTWEEVTAAPVARARHGAIVASNQTMYVFGGIDASTPPAVQSDVRRLSRVAGDWLWSTVSTSGSDTPGARFGHTVAYDRSSGRNRMIVFGGADGSGLVDDEVYALDFGPSFGSFTWKRLERASGSDAPPAARKGHTLLVDGRRHVRHSDSTWTRMVVFGGETSGGRSDEAWMLWIHPTDDEVEWQELTPSTPNGAPDARAGHAAIWQRPTNFDRMLVYGGETGSGSDAEVWVLAISGNSAEWIPEGTDGPAISGHTALTDLIPTQAALPEIYDPEASPGSQWTTLAAPKRYQYYPFSFVLPSGDVFRAGPQVDTYRLDLDVPQWSSPLWVDFWAWSSAMYRPGKILKIGGKGTTGYDTGRIEFDASNTTSGWTQASTNLVRRYLPNLTILPDGRLMVTGGARETARESAMKRPQIWTPPASSGVGTWGDTLAADPAARDHHSTAILLPDGRVLTAGVSDVEIVDSEKVTLFCPPYLFSADTLATRPVISCAPDTVVWGNAFSISTPDAEGIASAALVKPSAVTHSFNQDQRYVPLVIRDTLSSEELVVDAPAGGTWAPPGDYMLFLVDVNGVPSIAKWVRVRAQEEDDSCADVSPSPIALSAPEAARYSIKLTWEAPGENGACGTALAYDLRRSTAAITEANFYEAKRLTTNLPTPIGAGGGHCMEVDSLNSCTTYRFAIKTRDAAGVWSKLSTVATAQTTCSGNTAVLCDGGGLLAGGGEGGGESLRRELGLASTGVESSVTAAEPSRENSLLREAESDVVDLISLDAATVERDGRIELRLRAVGSWETELDELRVGVIDHDPGLVAVPGSDRVYLGTIGPVSSVTGTSSWPFVARGGEELHVGLDGVSSQKALVVESNAPAPRPGEEPARILVQVQQTEGPWRTVVDVHPRRALDRRAIDVGGNSSVRLLILGECTIASLARMDVVETVEVEPLALVSALGSDSEDVGDALREPGEARTELGSGEELNVSFAAPSRDAELRRGVFLAARGRLRAAEATSGQQSGRRESGVQPAWTFDLGPARPSPGPGPMAIDFTLAHRAHVDLRVYSVTGRLVRTLVREERAAGPQVAIWDGRDENGAEAKAGAYFYRVTAGDWNSGQKLVLVRR